MIGLGLTLGICAASGARDARLEERACEIARLEAKSARAAALAERLWCRSGDAPDITASNRAALRAHRAEEIAHRAAVEAEELDQWS